ncbi:MAG TPA: hypothetical protein VMI06_10785, partial [Terriglobia bacterium]|nr:hypothetical protein [Terriglobia bacterium]
SSFLATSDATAAEAALAIAADRSPQAFDALRERLLREYDPWFQSVLLSAIGLTRQQPAEDFLLDCIRTESPYAEWAIEAILQSMPSPEIIKQLEMIVAGNRRLARAFAAHREKVRPGRDQKGVAGDPDTPKDIHQRG